MGVSIKISDAVPALKRSAPYHAALLNDLPKSVPSAETIPRRRIVFGPLRPSPPADAAVRNLRCRACAAFSATLSERVPDDPKSPALSRMSVLDGKAQGKIPIYYHALKLTESHNMVSGLATTP